jgi:hypothetical protein
MNALDRLRDMVAQATGYSITLRPGAPAEAIAACESAIGTVLSRSLRELLSETDGFDLVDEDGSVLRLYSSSEIASSTMASREAWSDEMGEETWGDLISIARSNQTESQYGIRPPKVDSNESPLYEIYSEGWDTWQTDPPLAPTLGAWLEKIADAIASGDRERVYDTMWLGPMNPDEFPPLT